MGSIQIEKLRCEYKENPVGIDVLKPKLCWEIVSDERNVMQEAYQVQVSKGDSAFSKTNVVWDTERQESDQSIHVVYQGADLSPRTRYYYRVRIWDQHNRTSDWSSAAFWETAFFQPSDWAASFIAADIAVEESQPEPAYLFRKTFSVQGKVSSARIYATSLGVYDLHLNGKKIGDGLLAPGWTSYNKRLQYQSYDVTDSIQNGGNAIGVMVGNGWYKGNLVWENHQNLYGDVRASLIQVHIVYENGREEVIGTDETWKSTTGPIIMAEIYHGECYDARLEKDNWAMPDYDDAGWHQVTVLEHSKAELVAQENLPTRIMQQMKPIALIHTPEGDQVLDMGQNMVGWIQFQVEAEAGHRITLMHAETLDKDGNFYTGNLRKAKQTIQYICKGGGMESYEPRFTFQGFRYVKVEGYPGELSLDHFTGKVIYTDLETTGTFECSDSMINQLQSNIMWGQKGNFLDVPTDCPQRDERLGWTGDAQVYIRTAAFNMDVAVFFSKWLRDLKADQLPSGGVPFVVPHVLDDHSYSSSAWGDAAVICPWTIYVCYGDKHILESQYESMKAWVEYIRKQGDNEYLWNTGFHLGDWLGLDAKENSYTGSTPKDLIATAFYAYSTRLFAQTAEVLQKVDDAAAYRKLYEQIVRSFREEFVTPNGRLAGHTQTAHVLALMFDLVEGDDKKRIAQTLASYIAGNDFHLTTGFVGAPYLCMVLSENGYHGIAAKLIHQQEYPSWLYSVTKGATTIWEHWDGVKEDGSFWSDDMNSLNHYAYGAVGDWLYRVVAGIDTDEKQPGYKHIVIKPHLTEGLTYAKATFQSIHGEICSGWAISEDGQAIRVKLAIPANTRATAVLPLANVETLYEQGELINTVTGVLEWKQSGSNVVLEIGSGSYDFSYKIV